MKTTYLALGVVALASILGYTLYKGSYDEDAMCPRDTMVCPDGSTIPRSGPGCEFGVCKQTTQQQESLQENNQGGSPSTEDVLPALSSDSPKEIKTKAVAPPTPSQSPSSKSGFFGSLASAIQTVVSESKTYVSTVSSGIKETTNGALQGKVSNTNQSPTQGQPSTINETRYEIKDGAIIDSNNHIVSTFPPSSSNEPGTTTGSVPDDWETHTVNAVKVNETAPIIDGVPVEGLPGKYYVSENSFGNIENCEFSNRIYIFDANTKEKSLMYEENFSTLSKDDPRACNSEMYLLATDKEKLILKYHTINTNMICESSWSEPEKTWYLDVTRLENHTRRYLISNESYVKAEEAESQCRANLDVE